jgi:hypothetical protein
MLPLAFAAFVWPARRAWAIRAVEVLVALILSKFAIVAVLSLGGAAMDQVQHSITAPVLGLVLVAMGVFAPWALLRLVPLAELAAAAVESLRGQGRVAAGRTAYPYAAGLAADEWATTTVAEMRRAGDVDPGPAPLPPAAPADQGTLEDSGDLDGQASNISQSGEAGGTAASQRAGAYAGSTTDGGATAGRTTNAGAFDPEVRLPGLPDMWQADDLSWRPLVLGAEEGWPPRVWPDDEDAAGQPQATDGLPPLDDHAPEPAPGFQRADTPPPDPPPEAA